MTCPPQCAEVPVTPAVPAQLEYRQLAQMRARIVQTPDSLAALPGPRPRRRAKPSFSSWTSGWPVPWPHDRRCHAPSPGRTAR